MAPVGSGMSKETTEQPTADSELCRLRAEVAALREELAQERSRAAAQASEYRYEAMFQALYGQGDHLAGILEPDGVLWHANQTALEMVGCSAAEVVGRLFWELPWWSHSAAEQDRVREAVTRASQGAMVRFETTHLAVDGGLRTIDFTLKPVCDETGRVFCLLPEGRDITAYREAERALVEERQLAAGIFDSLPGLAYVYDEHGRFVRWNRGFRELLGWTDEQLSQITALETIQPGDRSVASAAVEHAYETGEGSSEVTLCGPDGQELPCYCAGVRVDVGGHECVVGIALDITARQQAEEQARQVAEHLRTVSDSLLDAVITVDHEGLVEYWNPAAEAMFGYSSADALGRAVHDLVMADNHRAQFSSGFARFQQTGQGAAVGQVVELLAKHHDGHTFPVELSLSAAQINDQRKVTAVVRDITERKRSETEQRLRHDFYQRQATVFLSLIADGSLMAGDLQEAVQRVTEACSQVIGTERVSVWLYSEDYAALHCVDVYEHTPHRHSGGLELDSGAFPTYTASHRKGQVIAASDVTTDARTREVPASYYAEYGICSLLDAPVWLHDRIGGILSFEHVGTQRQWLPEEERLATTMATVVSLCYEAAERRRVTEALRRSETELSSMLRAASVGITLTRDRICYQANATMGRLFGYPVEELIGKPTRSLFVSQEEYDRIGDLLRDLDAGADVVTGDAQLRRKDGSVVDVNIRLTLLDPNDHSAGYVAMLQDITDRNRAEAQLRETLQRLHDIVEFLPDPTLVIDSDRRVVAWNHAMEQLTGARAEDLLGQGDHAYALPFYGQRRPILIDLVDYSTAELEAKYDFVRRVGDKIYAETCVEQLNGADHVHLWGVASPLYDQAGNRTGAIEVIRDISEPRRAAAALAVSEERLRTLINAMPDIIIFKDGEGRWLEANDYCLHLFGLTGLPYHGRGDRELAELNPFHRDTFEVCRLTDEAAWAARATRRRDEVIAQPDGGEMVFDIIKVPLFNEDGSRRGLVVVGRDLTARREDEAERERLQDQLQQAMKMEAVGRLAGGVAHHFNNLLTTINGNIELALLELSDADPLTVYLDEVLQASDSAASLTRQLLAFSRRQIIEPKVLNLNDLVENMRRMLARLIGEDVVVQTKLGGDLGSVKVDPGQFEHVLVNLAVNARDAMPDGGKLIIQTANLDLDDAYCDAHAQVQPGPYVLLAVSDTGTGMDDHTKQHLFEPFFTTKPKGRGTGLGLATIFGTVRQAGGAIEVYSEVGLGSTFKIYLPRVDEAATELLKEKPVAELPRGTETVLLVEDEASVRDLALMILKRLGYHVLHAANGGEAFMMVERYQGRIDLLMTDVVMPGMNGRELAERLLVMQPEMRVLFTSGYTEDVIVHHGVVEESLNFVGKPYTMANLAQRLRDVLGPPTQP